MWVCSQPPLSSDLFLAAFFSLDAKRKLEFNFQRDYGRDLCETTAASLSWGSLTNFDEVLLKLVLTNLACLPFPC